MTVYSKNIAVKRVRGRREIIVTGRNVLTTRSARVSKMRQRRIFSSRERYTGLERTAHGWVR